MKLTTEQKAAIFDWMVLNKVEIEQVHAEAWWITYRLGAFSHSEMISPTNITSEQYEEAIKIAFAESMKNEH